MQVCMKKACDVLHDPRGPKEKPRQSRLRMSAVRILENGALTSAICEMCSVCFIPSFYFCS